MQSFHTQFVLVIFSGKIDLNYYCKKITEKNFGKLRSTPARK